MKKVKVYIDSFHIESSGIIACTMINDKEGPDFNINENDFQEFCDKHDMRDWANDVYSYQYELVMESRGIMPWEEVYQAPDLMGSFLTAYIQHLYDMEEMDIETPIKQITSSFQRAI